MVLKHRFLVPECEGTSDDELLAQAVQLACRDDFREKRARFHRWQEDVIDHEATGAVRAWLLVLCAAPMSGQREVVLHESAHDGVA